MSRMSCRLRSVVISCTESVLAHPFAEDESDRVEVSRIGLTGAAASSGQGCSFRFWALRRCVPVRDQVVQVEVQNRLIGRRILETSDVTVMLRRRLSVQEKRDRLVERGCVLVCTSALDTSLQARSSR